MEKKLYDAALIGDVIALHQLLQEDPLILDKAMLACDDKTPLHLAAMMGNVDFIKAILHVNNSSSYYYMCLVRDRADRNPLHLAVIYDKLEVLQMLINVGFQAVHHMCLARDRDGRNPLHIAAIHGRLEILQVLINVGFEAVLEKAEDGGNILHLCVKHN
ncbi:hypothetical protein ACH5RR_039915 [Cinchona calisaya]|uniref:Uncharacterized protein n=1 Tax=Cinchona calisaya TaxID=153742 RepID=A0ABD2Y4N1_9GENT